jgi:hypothetical protein
MSEGQIGEIKKFWQKAPELMINDKAKNCKKRTSGSGDKNADIGSISDF